MEFTFLEFLRGIVLTFLTFNVLLPVVLQLGSVASQLANGLPPFVDTWTMLAVPIYAAPISGLVCLTYGGFLAYGMGKALRRESRRWVHRLAYVALGGVLGYLTSALLQVGTYGSETGGVWGALMSPGHLMFAGSGALAVWIGWEFTSSRALRADARSARVGAAQ